MQLVLASNNPKKLVELQALFAALPVTLISQTSLHMAEVEEPHRSFVENALAKARHAAHAAQAAAIADDSGLCVGALSGLPGVDSAHIAPLSLDAPDREARRAAQDAANNAWLLDKLLDHADRRAHYLCVLVALRRADDPEPLITVGRWQGEVLHAPQGKGGFGYDPLMRMQGSHLSVAELDAAIKNAQSHRALAAAKMVDLMREAWQLGR